MLQARKHNWPEYYLWDHGPTCLVDQIIKLGAWFHQCSLRADDDGLEGQILNNRTHSLIYSAGNMHICGTFDSNGTATGKAGVLNNHKATIEATGYLALSAGQINNVNDHFIT
ncbi:hypothetical protein [Escherichia marmotae]|uniref:hypothetical protein n=1 Tax=Escherichia marmotae TaxID=1499973 RepID=UPI003CF7C257